MEQLPSLGLPCWCVFCVCYRSAEQERLAPAGLSATAVCGRPLCVGAQGRMGDPAATFGTLRSETKTQRLTRPSCFRSVRRARVFGTGSEQPNAHKYLPLETLPVEVEEAEAVEFVLRRRVA